MGFLLLCILPTAQKSIMGKRGRPLGFLWAYYEALPSVQAEYWQLGQSPDTPPFTDHMTQPHAAPSQTHGRSSRSAKGDGRRLLVATRGHTQPEPPSTEYPSRVGHGLWSANWGSPSSPVQSSPAQIDGRFKIRENRRLPIFDASDHRSLIAKPKPLKKTESLASTIWPSRKSQVTYPHSHWVARASNLTADCWPPAPVALCNSY
ncbi:hypothetical protein PG988_007291 [Apiospora saccharicola]